MTTLKVSEISARSPDMSDRGFDALVSDIKANGQLVPIWIRGDEVIDGRKRLAACQRLGIEPRCVNLDPSQDAESVSAALNLLRTHYSPSQRAMFGAERAKATIADTHKFRKSMNGKNAVDLPITTAQAAADVGVCERMVRHAQHLSRTAAPAVISAVKSGTLTLNAATKISQKLPKPDQPAAVAKVIESSKGKVRYTPTARILGAVDTRRDRAVKKPRIEQFARSLDAIETYVDVIADTIDAALGDIRRSEFIARLRDVRTALSQSISRMEKAA